MTIFLPEYNVQISLEFLFSKENPRRVHNFTWLNMICSFSGANNSYEFHYLTG